MKITIECTPQEAAVVLEEMLTCFQKNTINFPLPRWDGPSVHTLSIDEIPKHDHGCFQNLPPQAFEPNPGCRPRRVYCEDKPQEVTPDA